MPASSRFVHFNSFIHFAGPEARQSPNPPITRTTTQLRTPSINSCTYPIRTVVVGAGAKGIPNSKAPILFFFFEKKKRKRNKNRKTPHPLLPVPSWKITTPRDRAMAQVAGEQQQRIFFSRDLSLVSEFGLGSLLTINIEAFVKIFTSQFVFAMFCKFVPKFSLLINMSSSMGGLGS